MRAVLALVIFALSLLATLIRPRGVSEALSSCAGGLLMVVFGLVPLRQAGALLLSSWNILLFFAGLVLVAWATEQSGFFRWLALWADVGPNLTIVGSLSTVLWLLLLRRRQIEVSAWQYIRTGLLVTPPMLLVGALLIALSA